MNDSYAWYLECLFDNLLKDVVEQYPDYRRGASRDLDRLRTAIKARGTQSITIDLPNLSKELDKALSTGCLSPSSLPLSRSKKKGCPIPRLFWGMYIRIFNRDGCLLDHPDPQAILILRTLLNVGKKLKMDCGNSKTVKAVREFYQVDYSVISPTLEWDSDDFSPLDAQRLSLDDLSSERGLPLFEFGGIDETDCCSCPRDRANGIQLVADITSAELGKFIAEEQSYKHGPGAVADQRREGNKFLFPTWSAKLDRAFPIADVGFPNYLRWVDAIMNPDVDYGLSDHCHPSELIAVPKTQKTPRLIAKEPTAHQWCQQGILYFLAKGRDRVSIGPAINFNDQEPSRARTVTASLSDTHATIDLSSASDRMSCWLIERIFRRNTTLLDALQASRTRWIVNNIDKKSPKFHKLRKFSTQGSAVTFPVQTYVYSIIAIGTLLVERSIPVSMKSIRKAAREVQVFGDDIIVPVDVGSAVVESLEHLGFKVNRDKTFLNGRFKESCGIDAWNGHVVTPPYFTQPPRKARPESLIASVQLSWNFFSRGFSNVARWIESTTVDACPFMGHAPKEPNGSGSLSWPSYDGLRHFPPKRRFCPDRQTMLYLMPILRNRPRTSPTQGSTGLYRYFTDNPDPEVFWSSEIALRPET